MAIDWSWVLVLGGMVLVLVEVVLGGFAGFDLVLIGSAFVLGGVAGLLTGSPMVAYITSAALGVAYIVAGRRLVRERLRVSRSHASNVDAVRGQQGLVQQRIGAHEPGLVKVGDEVWRALPAPGAGPFEVGALVTVDGVDGVTLHVRAAS
jgi:membrane protein implicated in regulation of membrane protease activity